MDHHRSSHYSPFHHRQSLRPAVGSTMASRYGLGTSSSSSTSPSRRTSSVLGVGASSAGSSATAAASSAAAAAMNTGVGITSGVVSFMKKFVSKASGNTNSIDSSFQKYHQQMQKEQQKQKQQQQQQQQQQAQTTKSFFSSFRDTTTTSTSTLGTSSTLGGATSAASTNSATSAATTALHYSDTGYSSNANSPATTPTISPVPNAVTSCSPTLSQGSVAANESRPMSAVSTGSSSSSRGPLFNKIRAKVASTFQASSAGGSSTPLASSTSPERASAGQSSASSTMMGSSISTTSTITTANSFAASSMTTPAFVTSTISSALLDAQKEPRRPSIAADRRPSASALGNTPDVVAPYYYTSQSHPPMLGSMMGSQSSSLTNEQLTAHLTEEERQILQKVFQKEEEFRELALKNLAGTPGFDGASGGSGRGSISGPSVGSPSNNANTVSITVAGSTGPTLLPSNQPVAGVSHLSTNLLDPVAAAVHRRRSSAVMSADATGLCRICRKVIMKDESGAHRCSNCHELVCDDCSSYSSREESKYWMCSFCRRRGSSLVITTTGMSSTSTTLTTSGTVDRTQGESLRMATSPTPSSGGDTLQVAATTKRKSSFSEFTRVAAAEKIEQPRQNSLDLQRSFPTVRKLSTHQVQPAVGSQKQPLPQPIILVKDMTNETSQPTTSLPKSSIEPKDANGSVLSPGGNARPRIYSLSDDEELLSDDDNDEDDEEELGDEDEEIEVEDEDEEGEEEEDEEMLQLYNIEKSKDIIGSFRASTSAGVVKRVTGNKKTKKVKKTKCTKLKSMVGNPNEPAEDEYVVGGQSHGTLASMPAESLKRRRSSKRKKKKKAAAAAQNTSFNSDDELFTSKPTEEASGSMLSSGAPEIVFETISPQSRLVAGNTQRKLSTTTTAQQFHRNTSSQAQHVAGQMFAPGTSSGAASDETAKPRENTFPAGSFYASAAGGSKMMGTKPVSSKWWLLSKKVSMLSRYQPQHHSTSGASPTPQIIAGGQYFRARKSSESSDISDPFRYSPPQESLTPSSEYSRSPRESADSEMLGLTYSSLAMQQRRSIPSVLVDGSSMLNSVGGGAYLTLKDCYIRRGSAGRALPAIPVEPSRSMLDLPHSRKSSAHSLDIPMEQPRRASAPEGEGIRIVIDEVGDGAEVAASSDSLPTTGYNAGGSITTNIATAVTTSSPSGAGHRKSSVGHVTTCPQMIVVAPSHQTSYQTRMRYQLTRANSIVTHYERVVLLRDTTDHSNRTRGFGLAVLGGKMSELDGMLYAYITWVCPGSQAEKVGLKASDKILEWCNRSLVNCSYEQVANIIDSSGSSAELLVESMVKYDPSAKRRQSLQSQQSTTTTAPTDVCQPRVAPQPLAMQQSTSSESNTSVTNVAVAAMPSAAIHYRPSSAAAGSLSASTADAAGPSSSSISPRRRLPQIPAVAAAAAAAQPVSVASYISNAQLLLQVTVDANIRQLSVGIVSARGLELHPAFQASANMEAYAQLKLLPEMGFKICKTELSKAFEWNETLIYHSFPLERVDDITLELSVWCTDPTQGAYPGMSIRSPRHSVAGNVPYPGQPAQSAEQCYQLGATRIQLRSALLYLSEWWPLIPENSHPPPTPPSTNVLLDPTSMAKQMGRFSSSMEFLNNKSTSNTLQIMNDGMMMSHSTPGSRRGSDRSDIVVMDMIQEVSSSPTQPPNGDVPGACTFGSGMPSTARTSSFRNTPPTRASSTVSSTSTGGRRSLDDSTYSNTSAAISNGRDSANSFSFGRSTSLRMVQNRHSVTNLYSVDPNAQMFMRGNHLAPCGPMAAGVRGTRFASNDQMVRRKSSSALNSFNQVFGNRAGSYQQQNRPTTAAGHHPISSSGYQQLMNDEDVEEASYQSYLTYEEQQQGSIQQIEQGRQSTSGPDMRQVVNAGSSSASSDDDRDVEQLLQQHSQYYGGDEEVKGYSEVQHSSGSGGYAQPQQGQQPYQQQQQLRASPSNKLTVVDNHNKLSLDTGDPSRYSGTTSPMTPLNDDFDDDNPESSSSASNLLAPNWASGGRRSSFLRRLIASGSGGGGGGGNSGIAGSDAIVTTTSTSAGVQLDFRTSLHKSMKIVGEIKLSFIMTKGFLEIEVLAARNLPESATGSGGAPDTYVKTYLCARGRQREKRKTRVVPEDRNPQYRQTLKYDASIIYGRSLLVSVWEKPRRTFESNIPIGAVDINVNQLELNKLTIRWYRLRSFVTDEMEKEIQQPQQPQQQQQQQ